MIPELRNLIKRSKTRIRTKKWPPKTRKYRRTYPEDIAGYSMSDKDIIMGVSSFEEYVPGTILQKRYKEGKETHHEKTKIISSRKEWNEFLRKYCHTLRIVQNRSHGGWAIDDSVDSYIDYYNSGDTYSIEFVGDKFFVNASKIAVESQFQVVQSYIKWIHGTNGDYVTLALNDSMLPVDGMYPFLGDEKLTDYYDRYLKSSASILLLIGPPGTGKCLDPDEEIELLVSDEIYDSMTQ